MAGNTGGSLGGSHAGLSDAWLAHYDSLGNQDWILQLGTNDVDNLSGAATSSMGGVYIAGDTRGSLGGPNGLGSVTLG